jgi:hypothetical protein
MLCMREKLALVTALILLAGCQKKPDVRLKVLIGATTIVAPGAQPISDSIIVIAGNKIRSVGMRKDVPVPQSSDRTDLTGAWVVPTQGARIAVDEPANMIVLHHAPKGIEAANPADVGARIVAGEWQLSR